MGGYVRSHVGLCAVANAVADGEGVNGVLGMERDMVLG